MDTGCWVEYLRVDGKSESKESVLSVSIDDANDEKKL